MFEIVGRLRSRCQGPGQPMARDENDPRTVARIKQHQRIQIKRNRLCQAALITEFTEVPLLRKPVKRHSQAVRLNTFLPVAHYRPRKDLKLILKLLTKLKAKYGPRSSQPNLRHARPQHRRYCTGCGAVVAHARSCT